jgi:type IV secretory pathway VirB2 component (pilin)
VNKLLKIAGIATLVAVVGVVAVGAVAVRPRTALEATLCLKDAFP